MNSMTFEESKELKAGDWLTASYKIHELHTSTGQHIFVAKGDDLRFVETVALDETKQEHAFLVRFPNDKRNLYGTFTLQHDQVQRLDIPVK